MSTLPQSSSPAIDHEQATADYTALLDRSLSLNLTRGKPAPDQLDLAAELLACDLADHKAADGTDCRNYGGLKGLPELREIFSGPLQVPADQLVAMDNSSLALMHDTIVHALLSELPGAERRWSDEPDIAFLCPVPGYDRHFALCERFGIEMIPVPMTPEGPDMDVVAELAGGDPRIKGIWCVPKYSNPSGITFSEATVRRLAEMETAAPDFRIFWDNAYAMHHLTDEEVEVTDLLAACADASHPDRAFVFGSTSKITFAGAGVAFFGSSPANVEWFLKHAAKRTIGPDKLNQLRHVRVLRDTDGVRAHMAHHRELLRPKFDLVERILERELGGTDLATWSRPQGGYFVTLDVREGRAREVVRLAGEAGVALTPAGASHPYGRDPQDSTIRIAPSYPGLAELEEAIVALAVCVRLACAEG
ncbi:aminotransferase class I/II-fold pyridoxal phosphate-dependent enzyme [Streptomyces luteolus]|uniref:Aminotransferase class I/II-fold pyridoxal phosphate-dependent enzyme n=1 Tax=Streptomyces luteolus TaxID=3043615 RepID=A0ABT6T112_9ACTN|nr:aminotransferase class I/II-fold pyridoxal phosphate-dependent enzyme [Streptomyces sp. B-S-A12]MDI3421537.1 aminotransferase class I/II-fold pyridoxal phosphate-dependent enzyme [Streptomyces sp. B-S-A12]